MQTRTIRANDVRIPDPIPGEALCVSKYGGRTRKAVIVHPDDFDLFERLLEIFGDQTPYELKLTDTALAAHRLGERGADERGIDLESLSLAVGE